MVDKKRKIIEISVVLFLIVVASAIFVVLKEDFTIFGVHYDDSSNECESDKEGRDCETECFYIDSTIESCARSYGYNGWDDNINEWAYFWKDDISCEDYFEQEISDGDTKEIAAVNCVDELEKYNTGTACIENWQCGSWSPLICPESETQIRSCSDYNNCETSNNKPSESKACIYNDLYDPHSRKECFENKSYWYDSNNQINDLIDDCTTKEDFCDGNTLNYDNTCDDVSKLCSYKGQDCSHKCEDNTCVEEEPLNITTTTDPDSSLTTPIDTSTIFKNPKETVEPTLFEKYSKYIGWIIAGIILIILSIVIIILRMRKKK